MAIPTHGTPRWSSKHFPVYRVMDTIVDATVSAGLARLTAQMSGWGNGIADFDNDAVIYLSLAPTFSITSDRWLRAGAIQS